MLQMGAFDLNTPCTTNHPFGLYLICKHDTQEPQVRGWSVYKTLWVCYNYNNVILSTLHQYAYSHGSRHTVVCRAAQEAGA